jgi:hypothetical protein
LIPIISNFPKPTNFCKWFSFNEKRNNGSILETLLFLIYINDLPNCLESTVPCLYADDTQIFASSHDTEDLIDKLNSDLVNVMDWLTVNKHQSHAKKTKFMLTRSAHNLSANGNEVTNSIIMNNSIIESVLSRSV